MSDRGARCLVLVVETEPAVRNLLAINLGLLGCATVAVADACEAWQHLQNGLRPGLILLDTALPAPAWQELLTQVRSHARLSALPVALSGREPRVEPPDGEYYLTKPFTRIELERVVREAMAGKI